MNEACRQVTEEETDLVNRLAKKVFGLSRYMNANQNPGQDMPVLHRVSTARAECY